MEDFGLGRGEGNSEPVGGERLWACGCIWEVRW